MYESPINLTVYDSFVDEIKKQQEDAIMCEIKRAIGIDIDKQELLKALQYDRHQYEKGYIDGLNADKWVYCDDRLPETKGIYIVAYAHLLAYTNRVDDCGCMGIAYYSEKDGWQLLDIDFSVCVYAWQEAPDIPKIKVE